jgi:hypothetical protein
VSLCVNRTDYIILYIVSTNDMQAKKMKIEKRGGCLPRREQHNIFFKRMDLFLIEFCKTAADRALIKTSA